MAPEVLLDQVQVLFYLLFYITYERIGGGIPIENSQEKWS